MNAVRALLVRIGIGSLLTKRLSCVLLLVAITWPRLHAKTAVSPCQSEHRLSRPLRDEAYLHPLLNRQLYCTITENIRYILDYQEECDTEIQNAARLSSMLLRLQKLQVSTQNLNTTLWERAIPSQSPQVHFEDLVHLKAVVMAADNFRVVLGDTSHEITTWTTTNSLDQARTDIRTQLINRHLWNGIESMYLLVSTWPWRTRDIVPVENIEQARHLEKCSSFQSQTEWYLHSLAGCLATEIFRAGEAVQVLDGVLDLPEVSRAYRDRRCEDTCKILIVNGLASLHSTLGRVQHT